MSDGVSLTFGRSFPSRVRFECPHVLVASLLLFVKTLTFKRALNISVYTNTYKSYISWVLASFTSFEVYVIRYVIGRC